MDQFNGLVGFGSARELQNNIRIESAMADAHATVIIIVKHQIHNLVVHSIRFNFQILQLCLPALSAHLFRLGVDTAFTPTIMSRLSA